MLNLKNIYYHPSTAEKPILNDLCLKTKAGKITIVRGPSGSGKTTLLEVISGLSRSQKGEIKWFDKTLNARQRRWLCGLVFQFPERYFLGLSVSQELRLGQKNSVTSIRNKSYWNYNNLNPKDPVALNLFTQKDLIEAMEKAERRIKREKKEKEKRLKANNTPI